MGSESVSNRFKFLHWKHASWFIAVGIGIWLALVQMHRYIGAYYMLLLLCVWAVASWLTSQFVERKRPTPERRKGKPGRFKRRVLNFRLWKWGGALFIVLLATGGAYKNYQYRSDYELSLLYGHLYPANEIIDACPIEDGELALNVGRISVKSSEFPLKVISVAGEPVVVLDRNPDGSVNVTADIRGTDNKLIVRLDRNDFIVNRNNYLYLKRPDRSTLLVVDQEGKEALFAHYANPHVIEFRAKLYSRGRWIDTENIPVRNFCLGILHGGLNGATAVGVN